MAFTYGFYNSKGGDRKYNADQMGNLFDGILNDGVFDNVGNIFATVPGEGLQVLVKSGRAWFNKTWSYNDAAYPIYLERPDVAVPRIDAIVLEVDRRETHRRNRIGYIVGIPDSTPKKPTLTNTDLIHQHPLAYVTVRAGTESILHSDIEIRVGQSDCPFVTGILKTASIDDLFAAWNEQFTTWFDGVKSQLEGDVAGNLLREIQLRVPIADKSTKAISEALTDDTKWMTPLQTKYAVDKITTSYFNIVRVDGNVLYHYPYTMTDAKGVAGTVYVSPDKKTVVSEDSNETSFKIIDVVNNTSIPLSIDIAGTYPSARSHVLLLTNDFLITGRILFPGASYDGAGRQIFRFQKTYFKSTPIKTKTLDYKLQTYDGTNPDSLTKTYISFNTHIGYRDNNDISDIVFIEYNTYNVAISGMSCPYRVSAINVDTFDQIITQSYSVAESEGSLHSITSIDYNGFNWMFGVYFTNGKIDMYTVVSTSPNITISKRSTATIGVSNYNPSGGSDILPPVLICGKTYIYILNDSSTNNVGSKHDLSTGALISYGHYSNSYATISRDQTRVFYISQNKNIEISYVWPRDGIHRWHDIYMNGNYSIVNGKGIVLPDVDINSSGNYSDSRHPLELYTITEYSVLPKYPRSIIDVYGGYGLYSIYIAKIKNSKFMIKDVP